MPNRWRPVLVKGLNFRVNNLFAQLPESLPGKGSYADNVVLLNNNGTGFGTYTYTGSYSVESMGRTGPIGEQGPSGPSGDQGLAPDLFVPKGATGVQGPAGVIPPYNSGPAEGATGFAGGPGTKGFQGKQGAIGTQGDNGEPSDQVPGQKGATGPPGVTPPYNSGPAEGATGFAGPPGTKGFQGKQGDIGATGDNGEPSDQVDGQKGATGPPGVTPPFNSGPAEGATGFAGPPGTKGFQGKQGAIGTQGDNGEPSDQVPGQKGATGPPGVTPPFNSGPAEGSQGQQGPQGVKGFQGFQGPVGEQGDNGSAENEGAEGVDGAQGGPGASPSGPQGPQGQQGGPGATGTIVSPLDANIRLYTPTGTGGGGDRYLKIGLNRGVGSGVSQLQMLSNNTEGVLIKAANSGKTGVTGNSLEHDGVGDLKTSFTGSLSTSNGPLERFTSTISNLPIFGNATFGNWNGLTNLFSGTGQASLTGGSGYVSIYVDADGTMPSISSYDLIPSITVQNQFKVDTGNAATVYVYLYVEYVDPSRGWDLVGFDNLGSITNTSFQTYTSNIDVSSRGIHRADINSYAAVIYATGVSSTEAFYVRGGAFSGTDVYPSVRSVGYPDSTEDDKFVVQRQTFTNPQFDVTKGGNVRMHGISYINSTPILKYDVTTRRVTYYSSTRKSKENIKPLDQSLLEGFSALKPVTYTQTNDPDQNVLGGFIAEEAAEAHPLFAGWGPNYKISKDGTLLINEDPIDDQIVPVTISKETLLATAIAKTQQLDQKINQELQNFLETDGLA